MSKTANWSYTNTAKVKPFLSIDAWNKKVYGDEFEIKCTWSADKNTVKNAGGQSGAQGSEKIAANEIFTEDKRLKRLDLIKLNGHDEFEEIQQVVEFDMSFFNEEPDFKIIT